MNKIEVFYHNYIPADANAVLWMMILDEQLGAIEKSNLYKISNVNMTVTMPSLWAGVMYPEIPFRSNTTGDPVSFLDKLREYVDIRYPFVNIIDVRDTHYENLYEGQCLVHLWNKAKKLHHDTPILYFHSKGATNSFIPSVVTWRKFITHHCVERWIDAISLLESSDIVAVEDKMNPISGNFWWSKASYVSLLPDPIPSNLYVEDSRFHPTGASYRYAFEKWVLTGNYNLKTIASLDLDPYAQYCL